MADIVKIPSVTDGKIVKKLIELHGKQKFENFSVSIVGGLDFSLNQIDQFNLNENLKRIVDKDLMSIQRINLAWRNLNIAYYRGGKRNEEKSSIFDELEFNFSENSYVSSITLNPLQVIEVIEFFQDNFNQIPKDSAHVKSVSEFNAEMDALQRSRLDHVEKIIINFSEKIAEIASANEIEVAKRREEIENELNKRKVELQEDFRSKVEDIDLREKEIQEQLKQIDTANNTIARRKIRDNMLNDVRARILDFGVSTKTEEKRKPVGRAMIYLMLIITFFALITQYEIHQFPYASMTEINSKSSLRNTVTDLEGARSDSKINSSKVAESNAGGISANSKNDQSRIKAEINADSSESASKTSLYILWARFSFLIIGLLGTILYYIRWQNRWAEQHASAEFQLQQFYLDVNRANWVIETGLEWRKETESVIPETILSGITKNLFNSADEVPPVLHPADELASALIGSASKVKLQAGSSEIEIDKPGKVLKEKA